MFYNEQSRKQFAAVIAVAAPVTGQLVPLSEVQDEAFSKGFMGEGVAIDPVDGYVVSPVDGIIRHVIATKHAVIIEHESGMQLLIHIGINTVDLMGEGFRVQVEAGDSVASGQLLMEFDLQHIRRAGYPAHVLIISIGERPVEHFACEYREVRAAEPEAFFIALKQVSRAEE